MKNTNLSNCFLFWVLSGTKKYKMTNLSSISHDNFHCFLCRIKSLFWLFDKMSKLDIENIIKLQVINKVFTEKNPSKLLEMLWLFTLLNLCLFCPSPPPLGLPPDIHLLRCEFHVPPLSSEIYCSSTVTFLPSAPARQAKNLLRKLCLEELEHLRCKFLLIVEQKDGFRVLY